MNILWVVLIVTNIFVWKFPENGDAYKNHIRTEKEYKCFPTKDEAMNYLLNPNSGNLKIFYPTINVWTNNHEQMSEIVDVQLFKCEILKKQKAKIIHESIEIKDIK